MDSTEHVKLMLRTLLNLYILQRHQCCVSDLRRQQEILLQMQNCYANVHVVDPTKSFLKMRQCQGDLCDMDQMDAEKTTMLNGRVQSYKILIYFYMYVNLRNYLYLGSVYQDHMNRLTWQISILTRHGQVCEECWFC